MELSAIVFSFLNFPVQTERVTLKEDSNFFWNQNPDRNRGIYGKSFSNASISSDKFTNPLNIFDHEIVFLLFSKEGLRIFIRWSNFQRFSPFIKYACLYNLCIARKWIWRKIGWWKNWKWFWWTYWKLDSSIRVNYVWILAISWNQFLKSQTLANCTFNQWLLRLFLWICSRDDLS